MGLRKDERAVGMALWLVGAKTLTQRIEWMVKREFGGVALLQSVMNFEVKDREEAARAIREAGLVVTYHGNVQGNLLPNGELDEGFIGKMIEDVLWWQEKVGRVRSCCSDPLQVRERPGVNRFLAAANKRFMELMWRGLGARGIMIGLENSFGEGSYQGPEDVARFAAEFEQDVPGSGAEKLTTLLDVGHANIYLRGGSMEKYIRALPLKIAEVHVTGNHGEKDEHRAVGEGNVDLKGMIEGLKAAGYDGPLTVETCLDILNGKYESDIKNAAQEKALLVSRDRLRELWL